MAYSCDQCSYSTKLISLLKKHERAVHENFALRNGGYSTKRYGREVSSEISGFNVKEQHAKNVFSIKALHTMSRDAKRNQMDEISKWNSTDVTSSKSNQMDQKERFENEWTVVSYRKRRSKLKQQKKSPKPDVKNGELNSDVNIRGSLQAVGIRESPQGVEIRGSPPAVEIRGFNQGDRNGGLLQDSGNRGTSTCMGIEEASLNLPGNRGVIQVVGPKRRIQYRSIGTLKHRQLGNTPLLHGA